MSEKEVILDHHAAAAVHMEYLLHVVENVVMEVDAAAGQIRGDDETADLPRTVDVAEVVVAELVPHEGPVGTGVSSSHITRLLGDALHFAVLNDVIVAAVTDRQVGQIVDVIVREPLSDALKVKAPR